MHDPYEGPGGGARPEPPRYLVDAVMEVGCITDDGSLRDLVLRFGRTARSALDSMAGTKRRGLVVQLMQDLCDGPTGLAPLVKSLEVRDGNSVAIRKLRVATALWEVELLSDEEWDELFRLLDGVCIPDLHRRYSDFLHARRLPTAPGHCSEPWTVFLHAATLNARPGETLPCFQVLQQLLALGAEGPAQLRIVAWAREHDPHPAAHRAGPWQQDSPWPDGAPGAGGDAPSAPSPPRGDSGVWDPPNYLIIRIRPLLAPDQGGDALLSHWRRLHPEGQLRGADRRIDLGDAESEVRSLIRQAESEWAYLKSDLAIEFVLPQGLLGMTVERWRKVPFQGVDGVLGEDHHVVLRSLDRIDRRDLHGSWSRRWKDFTDGCAGRVHWFPEDGRRHLLSDPPPAVAVLSRPPDGARSEEGREGEEGPDGRPDELAAALRAGVPVVLWDRRDGLDPSFRTALRSLLNSRDLRGLPSLVKSLRISSGDRDPEEYFLVGRHVALLWDDPNRMPVAPGTHPVPPPAGREEGP
ncbi:effector-associated domain 2-containing protein [Streptomyces sp. URMC 124]|uniref:VMAP-C domain-containing protein n=1 Tax=Streptomyces sp. URMC 124 TaxID=3423405 RepID=UPI003F1BB079